MLQIFSLPNFSIDVAGSKTDSGVTEKKSTLPFGFSVDSKDAAGMTRLMNAVVHVNIQAVKSLIEIGANPSLTSDKGWNALHFAAQVGDIGIIDLIQNHLPNINSKTKAGQTPLMIAASFGNLDAVEWFLEKGATATCVDSNRCNMLHHAVKGGDTNIIDLIHTRLLDITSKTNEGYTPLMAAVLSGKLDAVKWFLDKGATVTGVDIRGLNVLHLAAHSGNIGIISLLHTRLLDFEPGSVDDYRTREARPPLMVAASFGKFDAVKWFLDKGASVICVDSNRWNVLHFAAQGGDVGTIDSIFTFLPDIESRTAQRETPLNIAVRRGNFLAVKYLLEREANPLATDINGHDSLHHASSQKGDFMNLLLRQVANSESTPGND